MQTKKEERPTLKKYLDNYTKLKKAKSSETLLPERPSKQKSKEELLLLIGERLSEIERLLQTKP